MPELKQKLDRFTAAILSQATAEARQALDEVTAKRDKAYRDSEDRILTEVYRYIHGEVERIKSESGREVSRHMLENKHKLYLRREEIAREVFSAVADRIAAYTATQEYAARLNTLFHEALTALGGAEDVTVFLRPADMARAGELAASAPEVHIHFEEGFIRPGRPHRPVSGAGALPGLHLRHRPGRAERALCRAVRPLPLRRAGGGITPILRKGRYAYESA